MWEKLLLAATITFSLNMFVQFREPTTNGANHQQPTKVGSTILVRKLNK